MKSAERALGSCVTIFKPKQLCPFIIDGHVLQRNDHFYPCGTELNPGECQAFRLDFILWFLQGQV